jgi:hypothetical protein
MHAFSDVFPFYLYSVRLSGHISYHQSAEAALREVFLTGSVAHTLLSSERPASEQMTRLLVIASGDNFAVHFLTEELLTPHGTAVFCGIQFGKL